MVLTKQWPRNMLTHSGLIVVILLGFFSFGCTCFEEWPTQREDAKGFTDEYVLELHKRVNEEDAYKFIRNNGFEVERRHDHFPNLFTLSKKDGISGDRYKRDTDDPMNCFKGHPDVLHVERSEWFVHDKRELFAQEFDADAEISHNRNRDYTYEKHDTSEFYRRKRRKKADSVCNQFAVSDPLFNDQWQLCNDGQTGGKTGFDLNVVPVWLNRNITGKGVRVCILDDGVDYRHPDLKANFDPRASLDLNDRVKQHDPTPRGDEYNSHGTKCAGVVAAVANNSRCGVGIAYNAGIGGIRILDGRVTDLLESEALTFNIDYIDIFSASWGPTDNGATMAGPGKFSSRAVKTAVTQGRNGLGTVFIWATGNGGRVGDDCNADGYVSNVNVISVGSIDEYGDAPPYMEECASTMAVVFVGGANNFDKPNIKMVTVTINDECDEDFSGTSAAAPAGAGLAALMLEANPKLTYRDVMHIVVNTATSKGLKADWFSNAAGHVFSRRFGFGRLDADKLVGLSLIWPEDTPKLHTCESEVKTLDNVELYPKDIVTVELETDACIENNETRVDYAEHVQLFIDLSHPRRGDINITLVSPSGTHSVVLSNRKPDKKADGIKFAFTTVHFWGEKVRGTWKVIVGDNPQGEPIEGERTINRVGLALLGTVQPVVAPAIFKPSESAATLPADKKSAGIANSVSEIGNRIDLDDNSEDSDESAEDLDSFLKKRELWKLILSNRDDSNDLTVDTGLNGRYQRRGSSRFEKRYFGDNYWK